MKGNVKGIVKNICIVMMSVFLASCLEIKFFSNYLDSLDYVDVDKETEFENSTYNPFSPDEKEFKLVVSVTPEDAEVKVAGYTGKVETSGGNRTYTFDSTKYVDITFTHEDYITEENQKVFVNNVQTEYKMNMEKKPILTVNASPEGATVVVTKVETGNEVSSYENKKYKLESLGEYEIVVSLDEYQSQSLVVDVKGDVTKEFTLEALKGDEPIELIITTVPSEAVVFIEGYEAVVSGNKGCKKTYTFKNTGSYLVTVTHDDYFVLEKNIVVGEGTTKETISLDIKPSVVISTEPANAEVSLKNYTGDIEYSGTDNKYKKFNLEEYGSYEFTITRENYNTKTTTVVVSSSDPTKVVEVSLDKKPTVVIVTEPANAKVTISGTGAYTKDEDGATNTFRFDSNGTYTATISADNYTTKTFEFTLDASNTSLTYNITLISDSYGDVTSFITEALWDELFPNRWGSDEWKKTYNSSAYFYYSGMEGDFFSYANFVKAVNTLKAVSIKETYTPMDDWNCYVIVSRSTDGGSTWTEIYKYVISPNRKPLASGEYIIHFSEFANKASANDNQKKRELAAFLANISHETGGGGNTKGLFYREELDFERYSKDGKDDGAFHHYRNYKVATNTYTIKGNNVDPSENICYHPHSAATVRFDNSTCEHYNETNAYTGKKSYHGRGPIQLSWNYNYGIFSLLLYGDSRLVTQPELILSDGSLAIMSAIWFWMTPQRLKPSAHDVMYSNFPEYNQNSPHTFWGFGNTILIINGGLEYDGTYGGTGARDEKITSRVNYYNRYLEMFGLPYTEGSVGDDNEQIDTSGKTAYPFW